MFKSGPKYGPENDLRFDQQNPSNRRAGAAGKSGQGCLKSSWSQEGPKMSQDGPKEPKIAPSWPKKSQDSPKANIAPKLVQQGSKIAILLLLLLFPFSIPFLFLSSGGAPLSYVWIFVDFLPITYPEKRPNTARKTDKKRLKNLSEAFPEKLEIANKPVS